MKVRFLYILVFFVSVIISSRAGAQCTPTLAADSVQLITNDAINATVVRGNTLYLGGKFTSIGKYSGHFIGLDTLTAKTVNRATWPKVDGVVNKILPDGTGGWIIAGSFTMVGDSVRNNIAHLDASGHATAWHPLVNGEVRNMVLVNNKLYICGGFTNVNSVTRNRVAAVDYNTGAVTSWNPNASDSVFVIAYYNGRIYTGGKYINIGGASRQLVSMLDTLTGAATTWNAHAYGWDVRCLAFRGSSVYVGGHITDIGGSSRANIAAVDTGTGIVTSWNPGANNTVLKMVLNTNTMYIGGVFTNAGGTFRNSIAEISLNADTATSFNPVDYGVFVTNDILINGNKMYICGSYQPWTAEATCRIKQIDMTTGSYTGWRSISDSAVNTMAISNGVLYTGGLFRSADAAMRTRLAAIDMNADTVLPWNPRADGPVTGLASGPAGIYAAGYFSTIGDMWHRGIAALDTASSDTLAGFQATLNDGYGYSILYNAGTIYFAGSYLTINGATRFSLSSLNAVTGALNPWTANCTYSGSAGYIYSLTTDGTNLYIGGTFTNISSASRPNIGAVNLASAAVLPWSPSFDNSVNSVAFSNGSVYVGGNFTSCNGVFTPRVAKVSALTGIADEYWVPFPDGEVNYLTPHDNFIYISGSYSNLHAQPIINTGMADSGTALPAAWNPAPIGAVNSLAFNSGKLYMAGNFVSAENRSYLKNLVQYRVNSHPNIIQITGPDSVCSGAVITLTAISATPGATYQWRVNGVNAGTGTIYSYVPADGDQVVCIAYAVPGSCYLPDSAISNVKTIVVRPHMSVVGPAAVCAGTAVSDTVLTSGTGITYQWRVNGMPAGTGSTHTYVPANGDQLTVTIHGAIGCPSDSATSPVITMTVTPLTDVLAGITANRDTVCAGTIITFTAHSSMPGVHFAWKINNIGAGIDDSVYSYAPAAGDIVKIIATTPVTGCYMASLDSATMMPVIIANVHPALTLSGNTSLCTGDTATYVVSPLIAGATYTWTVNGVAMATGNSYNYAPANGDQVRSIAMLPASGCYTTLYDTSNTLTILVNNNVAPAISILTSSDSVCQFAPATFYSSAPGVTGGSYQWIVNGTIAGTAPTYTYTPVNGDVVKCVLTIPSTGCFTNATDTSNSITMTTIPLNVPAITLSGPAYATAGSLVTITATVSNAGPSYLISWYRSASLFNTSTTPSTTYIKGAGTDNITATISSTSPGCYSSATSAAITVDQAQEGVQNIQQYGIQVYPNPFTSSLVIKNAPVNARFGLFDYAGRAMNLEVTTRNVEILLETGDLVTGVYLLRVIDENGKTLCNITVRKE